MSVSTTTSARPINKQLLLQSRPKGRCSPEHFSLRAETPAPLKDNELLLETIAISVDPTNRIWMSDAPGYMPPVQLGEVMRALGIGRVTASNSPDYQPGDFAVGLLGWQTYPTVSAHAVNKLPPLGGLPVSLGIGPLGMTGLTAYFGLERIGKPKPGETVVVSAAAGAVGSIAGQLAKEAGARVVGLAGSDEKCTWLKDEAGFDAVINYKAESIGEALERTCPKGIDVYFENVGGKTLEEVLKRINIGARIPLCGLISQYNATAPVPGPLGFEQILMKRALVQGFIILDFAAEFGTGIATLAKLMQQGKLKHRETIVKGFERLPEAVNMLFDGENMGKLIVQIADQMPNV